MLRRSGAYLSRHRGLKQLQGPAHDVVVLVPDAEIPVHAPQVARHKSLELIAQVSEGAGALGLIGRLHALPLALGQDAVEQKGGHIVGLVENLKRGILAVKLPAMAVDII